MGNNKFQITAAGFIDLVRQSFGSGYVEVGRIIASRSDLVPSEYQAALLHGRYYPDLLSGAAMKSLLNRQLRMKAEKLFSHFELRPFRRHTLGSTHAAVLSDGRRVLVTVNYPAAVKTFSAEIKAIARLLARLDQPIWASVREELAERSRVLLRLTDVAARIEIFAVHFGREDKLSAPAVLWPYTTPNLLVQRWHNAPTLSEVVYGHKKVNWVKSYAARYLVEGFVYQYGRLGHFLLRPHLDDFAVLDKNQIMATNFLATGRLEGKERGQFVLLLWALLKDDFNLAARVLLKAHYDTAQHREAHRAGVVLTKVKAATFAETLWHTLEKGWQGHLTIPLSFTMAAESLLFLETMLAAVHPEGDFSGNLLSAIKKHAPRIFGAPKSASLAQIAKTIIF